MTRRQLIWGTVAALGAALAAGTLVVGPSILLFLARRRLPKEILEPGSVTRIGPVSDFSVGVNTQFLQQQRICVVRNAERLYAIYARCPHQGCTPDWLAPANKFRCPCHASNFCMGSTFDGDGINCAGPAPRPLDRAHVEVDSAGQVVVDISKLYQWPKGRRSQFDDPGAYISLRQS